MPTSTRRWAYSFNLFSKFSIIGNSPYSIVCGYYIPFLGKSKYIWKKGLHPAEKCGIIPTTG
jgi:hypothetical protein